MKRAMLICAVVLALAVGVDAQGPVLQNANFDGPFTIRESQEVEVAQGWDYSYISGDDRQCRAPCYRPEWKPEQQIVVSGTSQRWFTTYARQYAAIHQVVSTEAGAWYRFACQVYAISEPDGQQAVFVGANPWAAGVFDRTMVWGQQQPWASYRQWHTVSVTFQAFGGQARVAVGSNNNYPTKNNAGYVDNCTLERIDAPGPEPTPQPTYTPYPTLTPYPTPAPCATCTPGGSCDYGVIRGIVREELDRTSLGVR